MDSGANARLALDTIAQRPTDGVPSWMLHVMDHGHIERLAGAAPGAYRRDPVTTYLAFQRAIGTCLLDQWIPENPLTMGPGGWEGERAATTGLEDVVVDGITIDGPEAVVAHLEAQVFPALEAQVAALAREAATPGPSSANDEDARVAALLACEAETQTLLGPDILKAPYGVARFPGFAYGTYGYVPYFSAYALYPEVLERHFRLQGDVAVRTNRAVARAIIEGGLPRLIRLDHDMADSRGTLAHEDSLERLWLPHFERAIEPLLRADIKLLWHCDGNLMAMVPLLLAAGIAGFQGFQYEDGMDYRRICALRTRGGAPLLIIAGSSVTTTLPFGTPAQVRDELRFLVEQGPREGLFLAGSSTIAPGTPWENVVTLVEGLAHYREGGRPGAPSSSRSRLLRHRPPP